MAQRVVDAILQLISVSRSDNLAKGLRVLKLENASPETQDRLMKGFIEKASASNSEPHIFEIIVDTWVSLNPIEDEYPIMPKILYQVNIETCISICRKLKLTYRDNIIKLAPYHDEPFVQHVMEKLDKSYGVQPYTSYLELLEAIIPAKKEVVLGKEDKCTKKEVKVDPNYYLLESLQSRLEKVSPIASKPKYILDEVVPDYPGDFEALEPILLPDIEEAASLIMEDLSPYILDEETRVKSESAFKDGYKESGDTYLKLHLLLPIYHKLFLKDDDELTRIYGPLNRFIVSEKNISIKMDGRMFRSNVRSVYNPFNDEVDDELDWFTGVCDREKCSKRIKFYHYAFRMPLAGGGWKGCYCSPACVLENLPKPVNMLDRIIGERDIIAHLTRYFSERLETVGIYDRELEEEEPLEKKETMEEKKESIKADFLSRPTLSIPAWVDKKCLNE